MMFWIYFFVTLTLAVYVFLLWRIFHFFLKTEGLLLIFFIPLMIFIFGFALRLSKNQGLVDLGFFLTDSSSFFVTLLFALALVLGQIKYWKV